MQTTKKTARLQLKPKGRLGSTGDTSTARDRKSQYCTGSKSGQAHLRESKSQDTSAIWRQAITESEMESQTNAGKTLPFGDLLLQNSAVGLQVPDVPGGNALRGPQQPAPKEPCAGRPRGRKRPVAPPLLASWAGRFRPADGARASPLRARVRSHVRRCRWFLGSRGQSLGTRPTWSFSPWFPVRGGRSGSCGWKGAAWRFLPTLPLRRAPLKCLRTLGHPVSRLPFLK